MIDKQDELVEKIAKIIADEKGAGGSVHLANSIINSVLIPMGLVFVDEDQEPPENINLWHEMHDIDAPVTGNYSAYRMGQEAMEDAGFKKVSPIRKVE
ncbi:MAG: hypothetical protein WC560_10075 [Syntrophales bacterium]